MLSSGFWQSATSIVAQALENLDAENRGLLSSLASSDREEDDTVSEASNLDIQNLRNELHEYKRLLDEAQMQHFELSKQSRLLIAEKEAEISYLKDRNSGPSISDTIGSNSEVHTAESSLLFHKLLSEKKVLEASLEESEAQLRKILHEKNELNVLKKNYKELQERFDLVKNDLLVLKADHESKEKQRSETIDSIVSEYSRLAAESELQQQKSNDRILAILRENEILVTKMHALEHSITELADRSVAPPNNPSQSALLSLSTSSEQSPPVTPSKSGPTQQGDAVLLGQKELKAKIVTLEFDLREKEKLLRQYEEQFRKEQTRSPSKALLKGNEVKEIEATLSVVQNELKLTKDELHQLSADKAQIEDQLTFQLKQNAELKDNFLSLSKQLAESDSMNIQKTQTDRTALSQDIQKLEKERDTLRREITELESQLSHTQIQSKDLEEKLLMLEKRTEAALLQKEQAIELLELEKASLTTQLTQYQQQLQLQAEEIRSLFEGKNSLQQIYNDKNNEFNDFQKKSKEALSMQENQFADLQRKYEKEIQELKEMNNHTVSDQIALREKKIEELQEIATTLANEKRSAAAAMESESSRKNEELRSQLLEQKNFLDQKQQQDLSILKQQHEKEIERLKESFLKESNELLSQIKSLQEQQQRLEEEHKQALSDELAALSKHLSSEHERRLQLELTTLQQQQEVRLKEQLSQQEIKLLGQHQQAIDQLTKMNLERVEQLLKQCKDEYETEKVLALDGVRSEHKKEKEKSLLELRNSLIHEKQMALDQLMQRKDQELLEAKNSLNLKHEQEMAELQQQHHSTVASLQRQIEQLRDEISMIDVRFQAKLEQRLAEKEKEKLQEMEIALAQLRQDMQTLINQANAERDEHLANYVKERKLRKKIHNKLLEVQGNIRVICRVRPILEVERKSGEDVDVTEILNDEELLIQRDPQTKTKFEYDRVFGQNSTQEEVFEAVQPLCVSVLDGYNVCIFAYGQTGSGKTYTMEGYGEKFGVSPRAINELFVQVDSSRDTWSYSLSLSMLEIYNESIRDLLDSSHSKDREKLDIRQTPEGNQVIGLTEISIVSPEQVRDLMKLGQANRAVGSHDMNEHSSRSHSILTVTCRGVNKVDGSSTFGKLHLIDLAGSERVSKTDASGDRLKEAQSINKSLSCLGDVINALGNKKATHVPYRNSKLTFLLQDSLGGNSKVLTFVNISPAVYNLGETVCSLNFASRCRSTELGQAKRQTAPTSLVKEANLSGDNESSSTLSSSTKSVRDRKPLSSSTSMASLTSPAIRK